MEQRQEEIVKEISKYFPYHGIEYVSSTTPVEKISYTSINFHSQRVGAWWDPREGLTKNSRSHCYQTCLLEILLRTMAKNEQWLLIRENESLIKNIIIPQIENALLWRAEIWNITQVNLNNDLLKIPADEQEKILWNLGDDK